MHARCTTLCMCMVITAHVNGPCCLHDRRVCMGASTMCCPPSFEPPCDSHRSHVVCSSHPCMQPVRQAPQAPASGPIKASKSHDHQAPSSSSSVVSPAPPCKAQQQAAQRATMAELRDRISRERAHLNHTSIASVSSASSAASKPALSHAASTNSFSSAAGGVPSGGIQVIFSSGHSRPPTPSPPDEPLSASGASTSNLNHDENTTVLQDHTSWHTEAGQNGHGLPAQTLRHAAASTHHSRAPSPAGTSRCDVLVSQPSANGPEAAPHSHADAPSMSPLHGSQHEGMVPAPAAPDQSNQPAQASDLFFPELYDDSCNEQEDEPWTQVTRNRNTSHRRPSDHGTTSGCEAGDPHASSASQQVQHGALPSGTAAATPRQKKQSKKAKKAAARQQANEVGGSGDGSDKEGCEEGDGEAEGRPTLVRACRRFHYHDHVSSAVPDAAWSSHGLHACFTVELCCTAAPAAIKSTDCGCLRSWCVLHYTKQMRDASHGQSCLAPPAQCMSRNNCSLPSILAQGEWLFAGIRIVPKHHNARRQPEQPQHNTVSQPDSLDPATAHGADILCDGLQTSHMGETQDAASKAEEQSPGPEAQLAVAHVPALQLQQGMQDGTAVLARPAGIPCDALAGSQAPTGTSRLLQLMGQQQEGSASINTDMAAEAHQSNLNCFPADRPELQGTGRSSSSQSGAHAAAAPAAEIPAAALAATAAAAHAASMPPPVTTQDKDSASNVGTGAMDQQGSIGQHPAAHGTSLMAGYMLLKVRLIGWDLWWAVLDRHRMMMHGAAACELVSGSTACGTRLCMPAVGCALQFPALSYCLLACIGAHAWSRPSWTGTAAKCRPSNRAQRFEHGPPLLHCCRASRRATCLHAVPLRTPLTL